MGLVKRFLKPMGRGLTKDDAPEPVKRAIVQLEDHAQDLADRATTLETGLRLIGVQQFTANGFYTPSNGTKQVKLVLVGGGGGGGGASGGASFAVGGGGCSGVYLEYQLTITTGGVVTIGAGGAGGALTPASGSTGGDTSVVINGVTYLAKGGGGGGGMTNGAGVGITGGGLAPAYTPVTGFLAISGQTGATGFRISGGTCDVGAGGSNPLGIGGYGTNNVTAYGFGAGGSGAVGNVSGHAGENGLSGKVLIYEYR